MKIQETEIGISFENEQLLAFFGNGKSSLEKIKNNYSNIEFHRIHQVHGDVIVKTQSLDSKHLAKELTRADAHYTVDSKIGLVIVTADCTPVLIHAHSKQSQQSMVAAIHAGWRGVAGEIIPKTISKILDKGYAISDLQFFIGPHIQKANFEVGSDVRDQILATVKSENKKQFYSPLSEAKSLVDLGMVVHHQLYDLQVLERQILYWCVDTYSNSNYHSYRLDKETTGRQLSFIALKG